MTPTRSCAITFIVEKCAHKLHSALCFLSLLACAKIPLSFPLHPGFAKMKALLGEGDEAAHVAAVAAALADSDSVQVNADANAVKRLFPVPTDDPALSRTVRAAQFLGDASRAGVRAKFEVCGAVENVRFCRNLADDERPYDGSCFVVFAEDAGAEAALAAAAKGEIIGDMGPAGVTTLAEHFDNFTKRRLGMKKKREGGDGGDGEGESDRTAKKRKAEVEPFDENFAKGLVLKISGLEGKEKDREAIKAACEPFGGVGWVEYQRDEPHALIRFNEAAEAAAAAAAPVALEGVEPPVGASVLEGDEERAYWLRKHEDTQKRKGKGGKGRKGGKGGGKGRKGGKGRR